MSTYSVTASGDSPANENAEQLGSLLLGIAYGLVTLFTLREQWRMCRRGSTWNARLLYGSIFFLCFLRTCFFTAQYALHGDLGPYANYDFFNFSCASTGGAAGASSAADAASGGGTSDNDFFNKAIFVLMNLPEFVCVSTFLLLVLVWSDTSQRMRNIDAYGYRSTNFRCKWMVAYLVMNTLIYTGCFILYVLLFVFPGECHNAFDLFTVIYYFVGVANVGLPCFVAFAFAYSSVYLAGFPIHSVSGREAMKKTSLVTLFWSGARLASGITTLAHGLDATLPPKMDIVGHTVFVIVYFGFTEIIPLCYALRLPTRFLADMDGPNGPNGAAGGGVAGVGGQQHRPSSVSLPNYNEEGVLGQQQQQFQPQHDPYLQQQQQQQQQQPLGQYGAAGGSGSARQPLLSA